MRREPAPVATVTAALERAAGFPTTGVRLLDRRERARFLSWREIRRRAATVAAELSRLGIGPGERVAVLFPTGAGFLESFFGVLLAAAVPVPLAPPARLGDGGDWGPRTARLLELAGACLAVTDAAGQAAARRAGGRFPVPLHAVGAPSAARDAAPSAPIVQPAVSPSDLALIQFSSGTTADPRAAGLSHRALMAQAAALNALWPARPGREESGVSWLPLHHDMGLVGGLLLALERPGVVTLLPPELFAARPAAWLRAVSRYRATVSAAPTFGYRLAAERVRPEELDGVDLSGWRVALVGGEPVIPEVLRRFAERFASWGFRPAALTPAYGLAEATLAVTASPPARPFATRRCDPRTLERGGLVGEDAEGSEVASVGRPLAGFTVEIRDEDGSVVGEGKVGGIWVRGPSLLSGYLGEEPGDGALADGWLDTGDLGFLDGGELYVTGRLKDVIILRGRNHSPESIEAAVAALPGVRPGGVAAAGALPPGAAGEELVLFVERERAADEAAVAAACRREVLRRCGLAVDRLLLLAPGALPRTSSGKIRRGEALRRLLAGELAPHLAPTGTGGG